MSAEDRPRVSRFGTADYYKPVAVTRDLRRLTSRPFDLLVLGGGIYGLIAAYDAALRGLSVALVERGDFAAATSFNHLKTLHGGIRQLQHLDLVGARESSHERRAMARIAPHMVSPLGFVMPFYGGLARNQTVMTIGLLVNALATFDRNQGVPDDHKIPVGRVLTAKQCAAMVPSARDGVKGGLLWYDYQAHHSDRLALSFALGADRAGAAIANYVEATDLLRDGSRISGVRARDGLTGEQFDVRATVTLNAAGPWAPAWMRRAGIDKPITLFRNLNVVTSKPGKNFAVVAPTREGRALVAAPWRGRTIVGTYEAAAACSPDDAEVPPSELDHFLQQINATFPDLQLNAGDITLVHRGVVPADTARDGRLTLRKRYAIWDHRADGVHGFVSMLGVKFTTARRVAELAVDRAAAQTGRTVGRCETATRPLAGGEVADVDHLVAHTARDSGFSDAIGRHLVSAYGTNVQQVLDLVRAEPRLGSLVADGRSVLAAEVVHAVRSESACRLIDVVARRTTLGSARHPGDATVRRCAELMQTELGWPAARVEEEIARVAAFYAPVSVTGARGA
jgi:glycerol-3-phosphate dehydrogenase